jgi:hypothetical protein
MYPWSFCNGFLGTFKGCRAMYTLSHSCMMHAVSCAMPAQGLLMTVHTAKGCSPVELYIEHMWASTHSDSHLLHKLKLREFAQLL